MVEALSGKSFETVNPATGEMYATVAEGGVEDINLAVNAARTAFESGPWADMAPSDRGRLLYKAAQLLCDNADRLAEIESTDNGLPINETKYVVQNKVDSVEN